MKKIILATAILALAFSDASAQQKTSKRKVVSAHQMTLQAQPAMKAEAAPANGERAAHPFSNPAQPQIAAPAPQPAPQPIAQPAAPANQADRLN